MNNTTSLLAITSLTHSAVELVIFFPLMVDWAQPRICRSLSSFRYRGFEGKSMQRPAHLPLQRFVDHLVLLDPALARKGGGGHTRAVMVAVSGKVDDYDLCIRKCLL